MARGRPSRATIYVRLDDAIDELHTRFGGLPSPAEAQTVWTDIWQLEAHHSTALEGNTLVLREVEALLIQGRAVGAKPLKEYLEVKGYSQAAQWVYGQAVAQDDAWGATGLINVTELRHIHEMSMSPVWDVAPHPDAGPTESPGNFRRHDIQSFDAGMTPPPWPDVAAGISTWVELARSLRPASEVALPLPEELARLHAAFEQVHPFIDGNGRAGRLALNLILVRLGYPPIIIQKRQRIDYLRGLHRADDGDVGPLGELFARAMLDNLNRFIIPGVAGPARLVPLAALADESFTVAALRQAAQRGRLEAEQGTDGIWRSSRRLVDQYRASKHKRGRPQD